MAEQSFSPEYVEYNGAKYDMSDERQRGLLAVFTEGDRQFGADQPESLITQAAQDLITLLNEAEASFRKEVAQIEAKYLPTAAIAPKASAAQSLLESADKAETGLRARLIAPNEEAKRQIATLPPPADGDTVAREIEARGYLMAMGEERRYVVLTNAIDRGDVLTYRAFLNAPRFLEILGGDTQKRLVEAQALWAAARSPERTAMAKRNDVAIAKVQARIDACRRAARSVLG